jgi:hypothetical protein
MGDNANRGAQLTTSSGGNQEFYFRTRTDAGWLTWNKVWHTANDGAGSGLDADLLDGINSTSFAQLSANNSFTGSNTFSGVDNPIIVYGNNATYDVWSGGLEIREVNVVANSNTTNTYAPAITFHWGNVAATAIKMYNDGSIRFKAQDTTETSYKSIFALDVNSTSDIRFKENINTIENSLEKLLTLNGVSFTWKNTGKSSLGLIAQEVEKVFPEIIHSDGEDDSKTLNYSGMIGVLVEAINEQQMHINKLTDEINELKK